MYPINFYYIRQFLNHVMRNTYKIHEAYEEADDVLTVYEYSWSNYLHLGWVDVSAFCIAKGWIREEKDDDCLSRYYLTLSGIWILFLMNKYKDEEEKVNITYTI
jgi:hypothetical protein